MRRGSKGGSSCLPLGPVVSREPHRPSGCTGLARGSFWRGQARRVLCEQEKEPEQAGPFFFGQESLKSSSLGARATISSHVECWPCTREWKSTRGSLSGILQLRMVLRAQLCCIHLACPLGSASGERSQAVCVPRDSWSPAELPHQLLGGEAILEGLLPSLHPTSGPLLHLGRVWLHLGRCACARPGLGCCGQGTGRCFSCSKGTVHLPGLRRQWGGWQHKTVRIKAGPAF